MSRSAADILLAIFEKVPDASRVERLLDASNLRLILNRCGRSDAAILAELKSKKPGELLLGLLEEGHTGEALVAMLPPEAPKKAVEPSLPTPTKSPSSWAASKNIAFQGDITGLNKLGGIVLLAAVIWPALILSGFFPLWAVGTRAMWYGIATGGAILGGAIFARGRLPAWTGAVSGALCAPGALVVMEWWTSQRASVFHIEIAAAVLLGALPGVLALRLFGMRFGRT